MDFIQKNWREILVFVLASCFFILTSSFNFFTQDYATKAKQQDFVKWLSPDETSNYIFTKLYAQTGEISLIEDYNLKTKDIMHPRSFRSDAGVLKPVSFLGIILLYGKIASIFGYKIIPFLTPFFAALGIIFFYLLIKRIFDENVAVVSTLLFSCFPPLVYYTARSMFHNVILVVFLVIGLYFGIEMLKERKVVYETDWKGMIFAASSGLFIGGAVISRTSELLWLLPCFFVIWVAFVDKIGFIKLMLFLSFLFLAMLPALYYNQVLYGSPLSGGYSEMNKSLENLKNAGAGMVTTTIQADMKKQKEIITMIKDSIFHFGIHPRQSLRMVKYYFIEMFPWIFWPAVFGFLLFTQDLVNWHRRHVVYLIVLFILAFILSLYYGSWKFYDNPDATRHTIGNSYTRYWLPIYMGAIPFVGIFITKFSNAFIAFLNLFFRGKVKDEEEAEEIEQKKKFFSIGLSQTIIKFSINSLVIALVFFLSIHFVLLGSEEGLVYAANNQINVRPEWERVLSLTEHNSTLITRYHDKLFFPERKVIVGEFEDKKMVAEYANLAKYLPLYYYNFTLPQTSIDWLNQKRLGEVGLGIEKVKQITHDFTLYRLYRVR